MTITNASKASPRCLSAPAFNGIKFIMTAMGCRRYDLGISDQVSPAFR